MSSTRSKSRPAAAVAAAPATAVAPNKAAAPAKKGAASAAKPTTAAASADAAALSAPKSAPPHPVNVAPPLAPLGAAGAPDAAAKPAPPAAPSGVAGTSADAAIPSPPLGAAGSPSGVPPIRLVLDLADEKSAPIAEDRERARAQADAAKALAAQAALEERALRGAAIRAWASEHARALVKANVTLVDLRGLIDRKDGQVACAFANTADLVSMANMDLLTAFMGSAAPQPVRHASPPPPPPPVPHVAAGAAGGLAPALADIDADTAAALGTRVVSYCRQVLHGNFEAADDALSQDLFGHSHAVLRNDLLNPHFQALTNTVDHEGLIVAFRKHGVITHLNLPAMRDPPNAAIPFPSHSALQAESASFVLAPNRNRVTKIIDTIRTATTAYYTSLPSGLDNLYAGLAAMGRLLEDLISAIPSPCLGTEPLAERVKAMDPGLDLAEACNYFASFQVCLKDIDTAARHIFKIYAILGTTRANKEAEKFVNSSLLYLASQGLATAPALTTLYSKDTMKAKCTSMQESVRSAILARELLEDGGAAPVTAAATAAAAAPPPAPPRVAAAPTPMPAPTPLPAPPALKRTATTAALPVPQAQHPKVLLHVIGVSQTGRGNIYQATSGAAYDDGLAQVGRGRGVGKHRLPIKGPAQQHWLPGDVAAAGATSANIIICRHFHARHDQAQTRANTGCEKGESCSFWHYCPVCISKNVALELCRHAIKTAC
jgi:hypothetical protein